MRTPQMLRPLALTVVLAAGLTTLAAAPVIAHWQYQEQLAVQEAAADAKQAEADQVEADFAAAQLSVEQARIAEEARLAGEARTAEEARLAEESARRRREAGDDQRREHPRGSKVLAGSSQLPSWAGAKASSAA